MPKRSLDQSNGGAVAGSPIDRPAQKKTERSHEENQERAYIAASRRADRSIEARVKSAQMASEIHKKRTGKGFKISAKIVQAEEMYEEEEDDMPRSYRLLGAHLQTDSPMFNSRLNAYLANRVAMASVIAGMRDDDWLQNPINKMFAEQFPNAGQQAQAMSHRMSDSSYYTPMSGQAPQRSDRSSIASAVPSASSMSPNFSHVDYQQSPYGQPPQHRGSMDTSSPALSPAAVDHRSHQTSSSQYQNAMPTDPNMFPDSSFTAELPGEIKMMAGPNFDLHDPMTTMFMGGGTPSYMMEEPMPTLKQEQHFGGSGMPQPQEDYYQHSRQHSMPQGYPGFNGMDSGMTTPAGGCVPGDPWNEFMDWSGCGDAAPESSHPR